MVRCRCALHKLGCLRVVACPPPLRGVAAMCGCGLCHSHASSSPRLPQLRPRLTRLPCSTRLSRARSHAIRCTRTMWCVRWCHCPARQRAGARPLTRCIRVRAQCLAFNDIAPVAKVHFLVIPKNRDGLSQLCKVRQGFARLVPSALHLTRLRAACPWRVTCATV